MMISTAAVADRGIEDADDPFSLHLNFNLKPELIDLDARPPVTHVRFPLLGNLKLDVHLNHLQDKQCPSTFTPVQLLNTADLQRQYVKASIAQNVPLPFTPLQMEVFAVLNSYQDLFYPQRSMDQSEQLRIVYCLHALNHMMKSRQLIMYHNQKLKILAQSSKKTEVTAVIPECYRDQGLMRPKILIIVPFRESVYQIVNVFMQLLYGDKSDESIANGSIINYNRFVEEYTGNTIAFPKTNPKPEDYEKTFSGNTDDNFRIGMSLTKKCLKLYTEFYSSDIIVASPLGLRLIIGTSGNKERDYDFLNSIELLIIDQAELLYAQNWENLLSVMEHLHLQPQSLRNTDLQRVRHWCLNGLSHFYRQTLLLTSHELPDFRSLFNGSCHNYRGKVSVSNAIAAGKIRNVIVPISQIFQRIDVDGLESLHDMRFQKFVHEVLPRFRNPSFAHCMIYVPSYFDFVRLRNYMKTEGISFVQICEYTKKSKIARARDMFFHGDTHFMLYSERSHFFRRTRIKGIRHMIMYQPPVWPHFYPEMVNLMQEVNQNPRDKLQSSMSLTVLYTKYDLLLLSAVLGSAIAAKLVTSGELIHAFTAE